MNPRQTVARLSDAPARTTWIPLMMMQGFPFPSDRRHSGLLNLRRVLVIGLVALTAGGCANAKLQQANSLSSYDQLQPSGGRLTKANFRVTREPVLASKTIYIVPAVFSGAASASTAKFADRRLVTTAIDRAICIGVSDRFQVVTSRQFADMVVHATVTHVIPTNATAAGVSTAVSLGSSAILPVSVPRLPIGLGGLSIEAEATARDGTQVAALVWAKGANSITTSARVSPVGDAYSLAGDFGNDFSKMLVTGKTPFKGIPSLPSGQKIRSALGGKPKHPACDAFGRAPGLIGVVASQLGLPPAWTDKGAAEQNRQSLSPL